MKTYILTLALFSVVFGLEAQELNTDDNQSKSSREMRYREPAIAGVLSAVIPGTGQFYNHQPVKGGIFLGAFIAGTIMVFSDVNSDFVYEDTGTSTTATIGAVIVIGVWLAAIIDGVVSAKKINQKYGLSLEMQQIPTIENAGFRGTVPSLTVGINLGK